MKIKDFCWLSDDSGVCTPDTKINETIYRDLLIARSAKWSGLKVFSQKGEIGFVSFANCVDGIFDCEIRVRLIGEVWNLELDPEPFICKACVACNSDGEIDCYYWADSQEVCQTHQANTFDYRPSLSIPQKYFN